MTRNAAISDELVAHRTVAVLALNSINAANLRLFEVFSRRTDFKYRKEIAVRTQVI
jgi:hypothetical protein